MRSETETPKNIHRISALQLTDTLKTILRNNGFSETKAEICSHIFVQNSSDGSVTHGVNRFPRFVHQMKNGSINVVGEPQFKHSFGCIEQWEGNLGPGPLNALASTQRAMEIALTHGIGCVGLSNTNHWMRGGYYAHVAAADDYIFLGWTNTTALMPAWGGNDKRLGNNPLVVGIPFSPSPVVLDMAMSQFSNGSMEVKARNGEKLSVPGGYTHHGSLSIDPAEILSSGRILPMGYWKGAGLALLLDILAVVLSGGSSTREISSRSTEYGVSQIFIAIHTSVLHPDRRMNEIIAKIVDDVKQSIPSDPHTAVRYPGEQVPRLRKESQELGVPVDELVWNEIIQLL